MNHVRRKGSPQGVQHGQNVDDLLTDRVALRRVSLKNERL
jgi:hypothetical protein